MSWRSRMSRRRLRPHLQWYRGSCLLDCRMGRSLVFVPPKMTPGGHQLQRMRLGHASTAFFCWDRRYFQRQSFSSVTPNRGSFSCEGKDSILHPLRSGVKQLTQLAAVLNGRGTYVAISVSLGCALLRYGDIGVALGRVAHGLFGIY